MRLPILLGLLICLCVGAFRSSLHLTAPPRSRPRRLRSSHCATNTDNEEWDVVVIGAGVGGLCAAAMCQRYGMKTLCLEAHEHAGGVAHSFERRAKAGTFKFDSGPSLLSGMSSMGTNPLRQVLDAVGTADEIVWTNYDGWEVYDRSLPADDPSSKFRLTTGASGAWEAAIERKAGKASREAFTQFKDTMMKEGGLSRNSALLPPLALRSDLGAALTMSPYLVKFLKIGMQGTLLTGPFTESMDKYGLHDKFLRQWFDYLAFALSGLDAAHTQAAPVAYTMIDLHDEGAVLDYPNGGMDSLIQALASGVVKERDDVESGEVRLKTRVDKLILAEEDGRAKCSGVILEDGSMIRAKMGVICNAPLWNMARLLEGSLDYRRPNEKVMEAVREVREQADTMEMTGSFMHLHLGIPADGLPDDLDCHHSVLDMEDDITAEQNLVIVSIPTVFDPSLAPEGWHVVHAYTAASEDFGDWERLIDRGFDNGKTDKANDYQRSAEYKALKDEKAEALWIALERIIPDIRERAARKGSVVEVGTPLTHRRFNRRFRGTYGPAPSAGKDVWSLNGAKTPVDGLLACGDCCFPGIGLPGVAASGTIAANTLAEPSAQRMLMAELRTKGALQ